MTTGLNNHVNTSWRFEKKFYLSKSIYRRMKLDLNRSNLYVLLWIVVGLDLDIPKWFNFKLKTQYIFLGLCTPEKMMQTEIQLLIVKTNYSGRRLMGSLWDLEKLIPLADWY